MMEVEKAPTTSRSSSLLRPSQRRGLRHEGQTVQHFRPARSRTSPSAREGGVMGSVQPGSRSIRAMLAPLFVVTLVSLLALWGFAASVTLLNALREHDFTSENELYGGQAQLLGLQLTQERSTVFVWLSGGRQISFAMLVGQAKATDAAIAAFERGVQHAPGTLPS